MTIQEALPTSTREYQKLLDGLEALEEPKRRARLRNLCLIDLYFLIRYVCGRKDLEHDWLLARCREVQFNPDGHLDLWARFHYKSSIITFGKTIQDILSNSEITVGIFSYNRPTAKKFLRQIKLELESNEYLKSLFPEVLWEDPAKQAAKWSEDEGIIVKRKSNPKEPTVSAHGLVDSMPTGAHFMLRIYDDVVTQDSITPDMIEKTNRAWELSLPLGMEGGKVRYIGTIYHFNDTYRLIQSRGAAKPRIYAATADGTPDGKSVLVSEEYLQQLRREMGSSSFSSQMLQNPKADETQGFKREWLRFHKGSSGAGMNLYIICDPANEKKKTNDYTCILVIGLAADRNYYLLDAIRDRLSLTQRAGHIFRMHKKWLPMTVGYEKYGMQADIEHLKDRMSRENYHFSITELGGNAANRKNDSIRKLIPLYEGGRFWIPQSLFRTLYDGRTVDIIDQFLSEEYDAFPVPVHDDMLDCMARIVDEGLSANFPRLFNDGKKDAYNDYPEETSSAWGA